MTHPKEDYIGDGVYTEFDGYGIWLKANDHRTPTDKVYLEASVLRGLIRFAQAHGVLAEEK